MFYPFYYYMDWTYILIIIAAAFSMWASYRVQSTYSRYSVVRSHTGITAGEAARRILMNNGISDIAIKRTAGHLTDRYVPSKAEIYLSDMDSTSIAAIGVAAHECGHAVQYAEGYAPLKLSHALMPVCSVASNLGIPILIVGMLFSMSSLVDIGVILFGLGFLMSVITLPVEYNASNRALKILSDYNILTEEELVGTKAVLRAAGMTYVAAAASSLASLLRLLILTNRNRD